MIKNEKPFKTKLENPARDPALQDSDSPFRHKLLVAMPGLSADRFFDKSVIYVCAHSDAGAMGIVLNQRLPDVTFKELLTQLKLPESQLEVDPIIHFGGPVETGRGFVLHSDDFMRHDTVQLHGHLCLTATIDIVHALAEGTGPERSLFALGYAGWGPGQLEAEMQNNAWLTLPADMDLIFDKDILRKWEKSLMQSGISPALLSTEAGHA